MLTKIKNIYFTSLRQLNLNVNKKEFHILELSDLNIFIGINGSGKSTFIMNPKKSNQ